MDSTYYLLGTIDNILIEIERIIGLETIDKESVKFLVHNARRAVNEIVRQEQGRRETTHSPSHKS